MRSLEHIQKVANTGTIRAEIVIGEIEPELLEVVSIENYADKEAVLLSMLTASTLYKKTGVLLSKIETNKLSNYFKLPENMISLNFDHLLGLLAQRDRSGSNFEYPFLLIEFKVKLEQFGKAYTPLIKAFFDNHLKTLEYRISESPLYNQAKEVLQPVGLIKSELVQQFNLFSLVIDSNQMLDFKIAFSKVRDLVDNFDKIFISNSPEDEANNTLLKEKLNFVLKSKNIEYYDSLLIDFFINNSITDLALKYNISQNILLEFLFTNSIKDIKYTTILYRLLKASLENTSIEVVLTFLEKNEKYMYSSLLNELPIEIKEDYLKKHITNNIENLLKNSYHFLQFLTKVYKKEFSLEFSLFIINFIITLAIEKNESFYYEHLDKICQLCNPLLYKQLASDTELFSKISKNKTLEKLPRILKLRYRMYKEFNK